MLTDSPMRCLRAPLIAAVVLATGILRGTPPSMPFPQKGSDIIPDPAATFGQLPNGVRYVIYPNHEPRGRVSLRLLVLSGSLEETANQRGLAHFLEHMAFNGSEHYAPGTLIEYFQRNGMNFGGDTNAFTTFDHTEYQIELPDVKPATVAQGLQVFSDMANTLLLRPDQIVKERPIILSEKRTRDSVEYRQFQASFKFLMPDALIPERMPIGLADTINAADRARFLDLYNTWYRPERMVVIVVGDIEPAAMVQQVTAAFSGVRDRAPARPDPNLGLATAALGLKTGYYHDKEAPSTTVSIDVITPYRPPVDSAAIRLQHLRRDLAMAMLNRRLEILSKQEGAPFIRANAAVDESFRFVHDAGINVTCAANQWQAALGVGEQQLRKALQYGYTAAELHEASANLLNDLKQSAAGAATRRSPDLANGFAEAFVDGTVITSPGQDLGLLGPALKDIKPEECTEALRSAFSTPGRYVFVSGNADIPGDAQAAIAQAYKAAAEVAVTAPAAASSEGFAYANFGPEGRVASRHYVDDLDVTLVTFANGVRLNLKKTPFEADKTRISIRIGAGRLVEPRAEPGLAVFSDLTFEAGGLGKHSADDLQRILAGRTVGIGFRARNDAFDFTGETNHADLPLEFQLLAAYVTDPGYRAEAMRVARKGIDEAYKQLAHSVEGPLQTEVPRLLADGDPRFGLPPRAQIDQRTLDEEKSWLTPQFTQGPIEIGVAGDFDPDAVIAAVAKTFGALPARSTKPAYADERAVHFPAAPFTKAYDVVTAIPKAVVAAYWPTADASDVHRTRRLTVLGDVFTDRLRVQVREKLGGAYSPEAGNESSDTFTGYGMLVTQLVVAPDRADEMQSAIVKIAADLSAQGVTPDELDRARKPFLTQLRESARTNQYWLAAVIGSCQEFPQRLEWARTRYSDVESITKPEIDALAREYLGSDRAFRVIVRPKHE